MGGVNRLSGAVASCGLAVAIVAMLTPLSAQAFSFELFGLEGQLDNKITIGGLWRVEERNNDLVGKQNVNPGLCIRRNPDGTLSGDGCNSTSDPSLNQRFVNAEGSFTQNGDNGNLNYDKGDLVSATAKITSDLSFSLWKFDFFIRGIGYYDDENEDGVDQHPDTTFQAAETDRADIVNELSGADVDILDAYVSFYLPIPFTEDRELSVKVGDQVVNWGESAFLLLNSINTINAPNATRLRTPGFDIKELFIPTGMVVVGGELFYNASFEAFWNYEFDPAIPDPTGTFFSTADTITPGSTYAMLSFGKVPEDPTQAYDPSTNDDDVTGLLGSSSRTILRSETRLPEDDDGQYGLKLSYFAEDLNGGTEFAAYYLNYHSRFPIASFTAADASCAVNVSDAATNASEFFAGCGVPVPISLLAPGTPLEGLIAGLPVAVGGEFGRLGFSEEPLPVETARLFAEYPEDRKLYGFSFNTLLGDWAWSGEIAYRPNQPFQLNSTDLVFAALQPAFPANDINVPGVAVIPGRRSAIPDFVETRFRQNTAPGFTNLAVAPNAYVQGYEDMKSWNVGTTFLNTLGGGHWASSFLRAEQIIVLMELGFNYIEDFPSLHELQFNASADTHFSAGADSANDGRASELGGPCQGQAAPRACRQNPTAEESENYPDGFSWGTRNIFLVRYQDVIYGINLEPLVGIFADWNGTGPGPGNNFIEGRRTYILGLRGDYLNKWTGELRYTILEGDGTKNPLEDRDNVFLFFGYEF